MNKFRHLFALPIIVAISIIAAGCSDSSDSSNSTPAPPPPPPRPKLQLTCRFSPAIVSTHDAYFVNVSGQNLTEVNLEITFVGEDAKPTLKRYWANWPLGAEQHVDISTTDVKNVQRIEVTGSADQGDFGLRWDMSN